MYPSLKQRLQELEAELNEFDHPMNDDVRWLVGVTTALMAIAELSAQPDYNFDPQDFDA
jgi:hypothetical protein